MFRASPVHQRPLKHRLSAPPAPRGGAETANQGLLRFHAGILRYSFTGPRGAGTSRLSLEDRMGLTAPARVPGGYRHQAEAKATQSARAAGASATTLKSGWWLGVAPRRAEGRGSNGRGPIGRPAVGGAGRPPAPDAAARPREHRGWARQSRRVPPPAPDTAARSCEGLRPAFGLLELRERATGLPCAHRTTSARSRATPVPGERPAASETSGAPRTRGAAWPLCAYP